jgi:hypothetical protein
MHGEVKFECLRRLVVNAEMAVYASQKNLFSISLYYKLQNFSKTNEIVFYDSEAFVNGENMVITNRSYDIW